MKTHTEKSDLFMKLLIKRKIGIINRGCRAPPEMDEVKQEQEEEWDCTENADDEEDDISVRGSKQTSALFNILPPVFIIH